MKHLFLVLSLALWGFLPQSAEGQFTIALGASAGANFSEPGVLLRTQFKAAPSVTTAATFNYYFVNSPVTTVSLDLDIHYGARPRNRRRKFDPYLIVGAHLGQRAFKEKEDDPYTDWGINAGAGGSIYTKRVSFFGELKYVLWGPGAQLSAGVLVPLAK